MAKTPQHEPDAKPAAGTILDSANQIWLAGLGAFAMAQSEGGRLFESLVKEGEEVETRTRKAADEAVEGMKGRMEGVRGRAGEKLDKLEQAFQDRVARALGRLGVPTNEDVQMLSRRIDDLNESLRQLRQQKGL